MKFTNNLTNTRQKMHDYSHTLCKQTNRQHTENKQTYTRTNNKQTNIGQKSCYEGNKVE